MIGIFTKKYMELWLATHRGKTRCDTGSRNGNDATIRQEMKAKETGLEKILPHGPQGNRPC